MLRNSYGLGLATLFVATLSVVGCSPAPVDGDIGTARGVHTVTFDRPIATKPPLTAAKVAVVPSPAPPKPPNTAAVSGVASAQGPSVGTAGASAPPPASPSSGSAGASAPPRAPTTPKPAATVPPTKAVWKPQPGVTWQWQLTGTVDTSLNVQMYDIDMFKSSAAVMQKLHADKRVVICYFSAGSYEPDRPDSALLAATGLGAVLDGWPDERWVDIRSPSVRNIMRARLDFAVKQGCDGVEPDNVDAFDNENGLGLTARDQLDFNAFLATEAHARGLSVGLKNTLALIPQLVGSFDWALNEECEVYGECASLQPFITAGKAVFHCEYTDGTSADADPDLDTDIGVLPGVTPGTAVTPGIPVTPGVGVPMSSSMPGASMGDDGEPGDDEGDDSGDSESDAQFANVYAFSQVQVCANRPAGFSTIIKNLDLDAYRLSCN